MKPFKTWLPHAGMLFLLTLFSTIYYCGVLSRLPFGLHEWAQADRLSLAINFYDRGMNFFQPATHNLASIDGITGVEFPIQAWLTAALGKLFGRSSISLCFRLLDVSIAVTGLYYLFRAGWDATRDFVFSAFTPLFIFCSPVYVYYTGNYLPDPAAASILFISFYFLLRYLSTGRLLPVMWSIAIATMAVLIKASACSYLAGIAFAGFYKEAIQKKNTRTAGYILVASVVSVLLLLANFLHIQHLNAQSGSDLFLARPMPFLRWREFTGFLQGPYLNRWVSEYLLLMQYPFYILLLALAAWSFGKRKELRDLLLPLPLFCLLACGIVYLFGDQFYAHDYYFLASVLPLAAWCLLVSVVVIHKTTIRFIFGWRIGMAVALLLMSGMAMQQAHQRMYQVGRYYDNYPSTRWLAGGAALLHKLHLPEDERIVVAGERAPNLSLLYFDRRGYVLTPKMWQNTGFASAAIFMQERHLRTLIIEDSALRDELARDSIPARSFTVLAIKDHKAILQLKAAR